MTFLARGRGTASRPDGRYLAHRRETFDDGWNDAGDEDGPQPETQLLVDRARSVITKSALIERDIDLLAALARDGLVEVTVSITTLDDALARRLEPRAARPARRLQTLRRLHEAGIPVGVLCAPLIPALNDHELEAVVEAAHAAGARSAAYVVLRLPMEVRPLFEDWLATHAPDRAAHVMSRIAQVRGGRANDARFGHRMRGEGVFAELYSQRLRRLQARLGMGRMRPGLNTARFRPPAAAGPQLALF